MQSHGSQIHESLEADLPVVFPVFAESCCLQMVYLQTPRRRFLVEPQVVMYPEGTRNVSLEAFRSRVGPGLNLR